MIDLLVISMPVIEVNGPTPGIYYIKGSAEQAGFSCIAKDLNIWFQNQNLNLQPIINYFTQTSINLMNKGCKEHKTVEKYFKKYVYENIEILQNTRYVGISLFSVYNIYPGIIFAKIIRDMFPTIKIIVGGNGTEDSGLNGEDIGQYFLNNNLAHYAVYGEGEEAIQYILLGKDHPSVNNSKTKTSIHNLNNIAYPDYDDFFVDFPEYKEKKVTIPIIGSRGCVRKCTFCNVATIWPAFRFRSGKNIAQEMIEHKEKYGIRRFRFTDSLINGSLKAFRDLCSTMEDYNIQNPKEKIKWSGQFICRSKKQMPEIDFVSMSNAGCDSVAIGIESGSEKVRNDIQKGFTEEDMIYTIDNLIKNNTLVSLMFIVGYPTETDEDFQKNIDLLEKYSYNSKNMEIKVGKTLRLLDNTPLTEKFSHLFYFDNNKYPEWVSTVVPDLTFEKRVDRAITLRKVAQDLGYQLKNIHDDENFFEDKIRKRQA